MSKKAFSVIIPTLNEEDYLPKLLTDLCKQLNKNFEIIVVDGHSDDKTKIIAEQFMQRAPIRFYSVKRRNLSYQRNYGAAKARGEYLIFLDADVGVGQMFVKNLEAEISKSKHLIYIPKIMPDGGDYWDKILFKLANLLVGISQKTSKPLAAGSAMAFQRNIFHFIGGYNDEYHDRKIFYPEDHEIIQRARKKGVRAKIAKSVEFRYSLRRTKREGKLNALKRYIFIDLEAILRGKPNTSFRYEMGGHLYKE